VPLFWDKLLPVPILNLCVPMIDRVVQSGFVGKLNRAWETCLPRPRLNLIHMACWGAFFGTMVFTGYIEAPHPGNSVAFWKKAFLEGRHYAGENLAKIAYTDAVSGHSGDAYNELGLIYQSGSVPAVKQSDVKAAEAFGNACKHGSIHGCANVAIQFLFLRQHLSDEDVARALDALEADCANEPDWGTCYLVGAAYETGRGRPMNLEYAIDYYERCGFNNVYACKGIARIVLSGKGQPYDLRNVIPTLAWESEKGDAESCWYIAHMYHQGNGLRQDDAKARAFLERACGVGLTQACEAMKQAEFPLFKNPIMVVPGWSSAMPTL
jgi:TPR repeat protein